MTERRQKAIIDKNTDWDENTEKKGKEKTLKIIGKKSIVKYYFLL